MNKDASSNPTGGLKIITVLPGKETEFEQLFFATLEHIKKEEIGTVYYDLYKSRKDARAYVVTERYLDVVAWQRHQDSEYGKIYFPKIRALLEKIDVEYFDAM